MITTKELAARLTQRLNGDYNSTYKEYTNLHTYGLDRFKPNTRYEFIVEADEMEYKYPEYKEADPTLAGKPTNTVTYYICGVLSPLPGSEIEGSNKQTYNTTINASVDFLIPDCEEMRTVTLPYRETEEMRLGDLIQNLIEDVVSSSVSEYVEGSDFTTVYYVGTRSSRTTPGTKTQMAGVGITLPVSIYITYTIVATGVSSEDIKLYVKDNEGSFREVYTTRFGIARKTEQQANVQSDGKVPIAKMKSTATCLTLSFDTPYRLDTIGEAIKEYLLYGNIIPLDVMVEIPCLRQSVNNLAYSVGEYKMTIAEAGLNSELNLAASVSVRLVEELDNIESETA